MKIHLSHTLFLLPALLTNTAANAQKKQSSPNLVFIMADQYRGDALGCIGKEPVKTPCLDRLAAEGVNFTNAVSSYPVSSPARAMLMTGMYPLHNKVTGNCNSTTAPYGVELPQDARCWSDVLKEQGYRTAYIGKWHLDAPHKPYVDTSNNRGKVAWNEWCPPERRHGFDHWIAYGTYDNHLKPMYWNTTAPRDSFYYVNQWGPAYEADKAIEYIEAHKKSQQPFALVVSMNPPHTGYELVPDRYKEMYRDLDIEALCKDRPDIPAKGTEMGDYFRNNLRNYYACITGVDENVGRIVDALKQNGLSDNTIVVFTSDHGICMGAHGNVGKNVFYEEAMRIPLILSWPQKIKPRTDNKLMIALADLYPSLLSLMGLRKEIPQSVQTFDLSEEILTGKTEKEIVQPYYYVQCDNPSTGYRGLRTPTYTYVVHATDGKIDDVILFDRTKDPYQMNNIAGQNPGLVRRFGKQLKEWLTKTDDPWRFAQQTDIPCPKPHQLKWHEAEMGAVFHYDLHVFDGIRYGQGNNRINPIEDYNIFNPTELNTDQWVQAAKAAGCKFAVLTATHETGFGLWQSDANPYCLKAVKWRDGKGDIVRDFVNSCRKYGIQPGIYVGIRWNSLLGIHNFKAEGEGEFARNRQEWYKRLCEKMVTELCTRYGDLYMIWFDGGADDPRGDGPDVEPIVNKYQPNCLFYHNVDRADFRWGGSESGTVGYPCWSTFPYPYSHSNATEPSQNHNKRLRHGDKDGKYWVPAMADTPLRGANGRHEWFWEPDDEENIYPLETLMDMYEKSVGRNATLIVGLTPDPSGLLPAGDEQRLKEWGQEINRRFSSPLARTAGQKKSLTLKLDGKQTVDYCIIQENIKNGERIRRYKVEARINGKWQTVCTGESVGHKRIEKFAPVETTALRLTVTEAIALPDIINFSAFSVPSPFLFKKGKTFKDVPAYRMEKTIDLTKRPDTILYEKQTPDRQSTLVYRVVLPSYERGVFFSRDSRPGDYEWPNNTNRLLPWTFGRLEEITRADYPGIPSNSRPSPVGDALLLQLTNGEYLYVKALSGTNSLSWFQVNSDGSLSLYLSTLGQDTLQESNPLLLAGQSLSVYDALRTSYETLIHHRDVSALQKRTEKKYFEAFDYLGWCTWEHYHSDIDESKVLGDMDAIEASGIPVRYVLIDDGHIANTNRRLTGLQPDKQRFPDGWNHIMQHKQEDKIKWIGLWYSLSGYWEGIAAANDFPATIQRALYPSNGGMLPGPTAENIHAFYRYYVRTLKGHGFDFLKIDNQSFTLPLYMGGEGAVRRAKECNLALERETYQQQVGLMNCMAHNTLNTDHTLHSAVTRVSIDYKKYDEDMAKSHLFQSYTNTLLLGQAVWPDHDMFHSSDTVCGSLMARSKALSGGPVYLSDSPREFVKEHIFPLIDEKGKLFRPDAPAVPAPESILTNPLRDGKAYRVFAPTGDEAVSILCYNLNVSPEFRQVTAYIRPADYLLRLRFDGKPTTQPDGVLLYDWKTQKAERLIHEKAIKLTGFTDELYHLCPVRDGWAVVGIQEKYLSPATVEILSSSPQQIKLKVFCAGTLRIWAEKDGNQELRSIFIGSPREIVIDK